jgi:DNA-binding transcriptional LysR family regulator
MALPTWTPDLASLELLLAVAELGSVGKAAAAQHISQPSASARLDRLERQLGVALLVRTSRGSALTPTGEAVLAWARDVVGAARTLTDGVSALRAGQRARLRVAASLTIAEYLLPQWLLRLRNQRHELEIAVAVANSHDVCERVQSGAADLGFIETPDPPAQLQCREVGTDQLALVVAAKYPLAARAAEGISARDLLGQPLLLREPGSGTRDTFLHALHEALGPDVEPDHPTELGSTTTIIATALAGGGIGVVSSRAVVAEVAVGRLVELHVADLHLQRKLRAVWIGRHPSDIAEDLITIAARATHGRRHHTV